MLSSCVVDYVLINVVVIESYSKNEIMGVLMVGRNP